MTEWKLYHHFFIARTWGAAIWDHLAGNQKDHYEIQVSIRSISMSGIKQNTKQKPIWAHCLSI